MCPFVGCKCLGKRRSPRNHFISKQYRYLLYYISLNHYTHHSSPEVATRFRHGQCCWYQVVTETWPWWAWSSNWCWNAGRSWPPPTAQWSPRRGGAACTAPPSPAPTACRLDRGSPWPQTGAACAAEAVSGHRSTTSGGICRICRAGS